MTASLSTGKTIDLGYVATIAGLARRQAAQRRCGDEKLSEERCSIG